VADGLIEERREARLRGTRGFYHPGFPMTTDHRARS
jgi:hypothetical protein